jgi:1,4-alpha-glucan branching enzyme
VERWALDAAEDHAGNFLFNRDRQAEWLDSRLDGVPANIICPYDAELFGHWWYEGPRFLGAVMRKALTEPHGISLASPRDYLDRHPNPPKSQPAFSSWGAGGYADVWLNGTNDWIYPHLHKVGDRMHDTANLPERGDLDRRARNQMARELLLAQSSDWAFIMKTGTMVEYAVKRTMVHVHNCLVLGDQIAGSRIDEGFLRNLELTNNIFPEIDYRHYRG